MADKLSDLGLEYSCFICGKKVKSEGFDVGAVVLITNWDNEDEKKQRSQQFFCHIMCFKGIAHKQFKSEFYILEDDFEK